jgi:signal transduction histidine kinase
VSITSKRSPVSARDFDSFRRQESTLILASLAVLAALLLVHVSFQSTLGAPSRPLLLTLSLYLLFLVLELAGLKAIGRPPSRGALHAYSTASVWIALGFVSVATFVGEVEDRHYSVLMVLPVVSAAFRLSLSGTLGLAGLAGLLNFVEVRYFYLKHPPEKVSEYFEAFSVSLLLLLVGMVVWLLANGLRREHVKLERSLEELELTRDKLVAEEKLAVVGRLASAIAHEIRNPVAMIGSSLAAATGGELAPARREEMFRIAATEARRLETLTTEFLSYARTRKPELKRTSVATTLGYVADLVRAKAAETGARVEVNCDEALLAVLDPFQVQQALLNLALNALDATPAGGRVLLVAAPAEGGGYDLVVENQGHVIPPETVARIFEPFFTSKPGGTGLGLAIARNIARAHGGDAVLAVNEPGRVRFALHFPGAAAP